MKKTELLVLLGLVALILATGFLWQTLSEADYEEQPYIRDEILFDTLITIKAFGPDKRAVEESVDEAFTEMAKVDRELNYHSASSALADLNRSEPGKPQRLTGHLLQVASLADRYRKKTKGAFNPAVGPIMDLWDFAQAKKPPTSQAIARLLPLVDPANVELDLRKRTILIKKAGVRLDFGGVAKGYALDQAVQTLRSGKLTAAIVSAGSVTRVHGRKPSNATWKVGVRHPRRGERDLLGTLTLDEGAVSTSGDYQQFFEANGVRYHHILDPGTGLPARSLQSVTIVTSRSAAEADLLSTAVFAMDPEEAKEFVRDTDDVEALMVSASGRLWISPGLGPAFKQTRTGS